MANNFEPAIVEEARQAIEHAPYGAKEAMVRKWAEMIKISPGHLRRLLTDPARKRDRKSSPKKPEYYGWTEIIFQIKKRPPEEAGEISTEDALAIGIKSGELPAEAALVPVGTYNQIARKAGYTKKETRANRFQAERPNQAHHFDASTSKFFYIHRTVNGEHILRMHRPAKHYKNKPIPVGLRPWIYGVVDDHSGKLITRYTAAHGESAGDSMSFLSWAWEEMGLPDKLFADQGMLKKSLASLNLMERLGIEFPQMMPYQKRGHGKIERPWRTAWQKFEMLFFAVDAWDKFEISMTEINAQMQNYLADKYNKLPHRFERTITREQAWNRVNLHGGIVRVPKDMLETVAKRKERTVGVDGMLNYPGGPYEVRGLYNAKVWVYEGIFNDKLIVQDIATGKKYEVRNFKPLPLDTYRAHVDIPHVILKKEDSGEERMNITANAMLYADKKTADEKVISIPIRTKEERAIDDPFDVENYISLPDAMNDFMNYLSGMYLSQEERSEVERAIEANSLSKKFVENFALEVRAQMVKQVAI